MSFVIKQLSRAHSRNGLQLNMKCILNTFRTMFKDFGPTVLSPFFQMHFSWHWKLYILTTVTSQHNADTNCLSVRNDNKYMTTSNIFIFMYAIFHETVNCRIPHSLWYVIYTVIVAGKIRNKYQVHTCATGYLQKCTKRCFFYLLTDGYFNYHREKSPKVYSH